jgi:citrate lyase subunit beta/citryl-CoA lyase
MKRRSQLFVPAISEKMIRKSTELEADSIIFDLEDSVPYEDKEKARENLRRLLEELQWKNKELCVRINNIGTKEGLKDLFLMSEIQVNTIVIPKAEGDLSFIYKATGKNLEPLVETARGFVKIEELVRSEGIVSISYGAADLSLSTGGEVKTYEKNDYVKTKIVMYAKTYGIDPIDKVFFDLNDLNGFEEECVHAKKLGYVGKQVIHPSQIPISNKVFSPTKEEIEWAKRVISEYEKAVKEGKGAIRLEDKLIDNVHYSIAKKIINDYG